MCPWNISLTILKLDRGIKGSCMRSSISGRSAWFRGGIEETGLVLICRYGGERWSVEAGMD